METKPIYKEGFIQGSGIKLHYLDWGGSGQPLVLIHGLGDSPYIFNDLASQLYPNFRVLAYSRRGHCKSETADSKYDNTTLTLDLKLLLDGLNISKANLLGWSMGGNEITEFALRFPERTNKLIYFESGYDLSEDTFKAILKAIPKSPFPNKLDLNSLDAYRKWYHSFWFADIDWNPTLEENLLASTQILPNNSVVPIPNDSIFELVLKSAMNYHRDYKQIHAPALVIYSKPFFYPPNSVDEIMDFYENLENELIHPWRLRNMSRMKTELKDVTIVEMSKGTHTSFIFLSRDLIIQSINSFLLKK